MEQIGNLEKLKVGDYLKVYLKSYNQTSLIEYHIVKVEKIEEKKIICSAIRTTIQNSVGLETHSYFNREVNTFIINKFIVKPIKRKLRNKNYSYNNKGFIIFRLSQSEGNKIIKEVILQRLK